MPPTTVPLRLGGFAQHICEKLDENFLFSNYTDVTLVSHDKKYFRAHKIVLVSSSLTLCNILLEHKNQEPVIYFPGADGQLLKAFLDYMYLGYTVLTPDTVNSFSVLSKEMNLKGLASMSCWSNQENTLPQNETMVNEDDNFNEESEDANKGENNCFKNTKNEYGQINEPDGVQSLYDDKLRFNYGDSNINDDIDRMPKQECAVIVKKN